MTAIARRQVFLVLCGVMLRGAAGAGPGEQHEVAFPLQNDGGVPVWIVAGPFEQSMSGFGIFTDVDAVGEQSALPFAGKRESSPALEGGSVWWHGESADGRGYLDLNATLGWAVPGKGPERLVTAKAGYAFCELESPDDREALLLLGSNSQLRVFVNGKLALKSDAVRNAVRDGDTARIALRRGRNSLLVKVGNTHNNYWMTFFGVPEWGWGVYARLTHADGTPMKDLRVLVSGDGGISYSLRTTIFFKRLDGGLRQRIDLMVSSSLREKRSGLLRLELGGETTDIAVPDIAFGENMVSFYVPPVSVDTPVRSTLRLGNESYRSVDTIRAEKQYELHLMLLTHTDIGYTNPQPVVKERQLRALDQVLDLCARYPDFRWTMETVWPLKEFEKARSKEKFQRLVDLLRNGKVALSPFYTNPFTGWVSEEEMIRSLTYAEEYSRRYGFRIGGAVYDDVPGLSWFVPQILKKAGVAFLVCGLNELYNDYSFQRSLPKAFQWQGSDGSLVLTYRTETYVEGAAYGLERNALAIQQRMWERLKRLGADGYQPAMVLLNAALSDNADVAEAQFLAAKKWNDEYAYPRFVFTTLTAFADTFASRYGSGCPIVRGDWTSTWDILYQGEPARMIRQRWAQHHLPEAEALATISALLDSGQTPLGGEVQRAYDALLHFSGHGSGLEAGYGTRSENAITMQYREQYVRNAWLETEEILERAVTRLAAPEEAFDAAGALVFNTLSWRRDAPMALELKDSSSAQYDVKDLVTGKSVPSFREGNWLYLVAPGLPPVGYKKFRGDPRSATGAGGVTDLSVRGDVIENGFYRITIDRRGQRLQSIERKSDGRQLVDQGSPYPFAGLIRSRPFANERFTAVPPQRETMRILDQRPARVVIEWLADGGILLRTRLILWSSVDRVDVTCTVNLEALGETATTEEYCLAFPFSVSTPSLRVETLGGFLDPAKDRFPGIAHNGYSIRRSVALSDSSLTIALACVDNRVVFLEGDTARGRMAVLANLVNNFPKSWNRNEENAGQLEFRFSLRGFTGPCDPASVSRSGWEAATDPAAKVTFFHPLPGERSFFNVSARSVALTALGSKGAPGAYFMRLVNADPDRADSVRVESMFFDRLDAERVIAGTLRTEPVPLEKGILSLRLGPNESTTVLLREKRRAQGVR